MKYLLISILALTFFTLFFSSSVHAYDFSTVNNKFGIHLAQPETADIEAAADLVNSNGGRWGYVTLVMQENDRDRGKWQNIFDKLRELHLIPIIRLATQPTGDSWRKPNKEDAVEWSKFLDSLHWVVKNRYIILFNEVNHASEWGGTLNPEDYTDISYYFAKNLKNRNVDFFIMLAGFDSAAPQAPPNYLDEVTYLRRMFAQMSVAQYSDFFEYIDGLSSHSYPNPGFSGSPYAVGRNSIRNYDWELRILKDFGVTKDLPVFITETGWTNASSPENIRIAYINTWLQDSRVVAVTPFVLSYLTPPFEQFSWRRDENSFNPQYELVKAMDKVRGDPEIIDGGFLSFEKPGALVMNSNYTFTVTLDNRGEAVWDRDDGYYIDVEPQTDLLTISHNLVKAYPQRKTTIVIHVKTGDKLGKTTLELNLYRKGKKIATAGSWNVEVLPLPSMDLHLRLLGKPLSEIYTVEVQFFDNKELLVYKEKNVPVNNGIAHLDTVPGVVLGDFYRVVAIKPTYLPRQNFVKVSRGVNTVEFEPFLPLDLNGDGKFDVQDLKAAFFNPAMLPSLIGL